MGKIISRLLALPDLARHSVFLWGPRRTGKSYWIRGNLPDAPLIDLLQTDTFAEYASRPSLLRERYAAEDASSRRGPIVIDEIQKVPALLDEVHWLIENRRLTFLLTGSSARKLRRGHANLLAGRARRREMRPLCFPEVDRLDLEQVVVSGLLPPHFVSDDPADDIRSYVNDYLKEEIVAEGLAIDLLTRARAPVAHLEILIAIGAKSHQLHQDEVLDAMTEFRRAGFRLSEASTETRHAGIRS